MAKKLFLFGSVGGSNPDSSQNGDFVKKTELSLGFGSDGKLYIMVAGSAIGDGVEIDGTIVPSEGVAVFAADFSGESPSATQFYSWEGREYDGAIYDALANIQCADGVVKLTSVYDSDKGKWIKQMMTTGGLFESDDFTCKFRAKFCGLAGSWNNVITYGTGTHWTNGTYSDGVKWPAGGEIDAFEQVGGYAETPNYFITVAHWGSGTNSGYPDTHLHESAKMLSTALPVDEWAEFKFSLKNGVVTTYLNDELIATQDLKDKVVNNNYLCDYKPYLKPQAFYIDGSCYSGTGNAHTDYEYSFEVSDFEVYQDQDLECTGLEIYPQMWARGTELVFPVGAELYLDRVYIPSNTSNKACIWESTNSSVATVVQGFVKVLTTGTTTIRATCGNVTAEYVLTASESASVPCAKLTTDSDSGVIIAEGDTADITAYVYPKFATDTITWGTTDSGVVTVNNGKLTGVGAGTANITVTCGTKIVAFPVTVSEGMTPYISYDFTPLAEFIYEPYLGNETKTIPNKGSGGSVLDVAMNATKTTYNASGEYDVDGFVSCYGGASGTLTEAINFKSQPLAFVYTLGGTGAQQTNNGGNANKMPSLSGVKLRYGNVNPVDVTLTGNDKIVVYYDGTTGYAYQNGALLTSGSAGYLVADFTVIQFASLTGTNMKNLDVYLGETFTEDELIAMSMPD